MTFPLAPVYQRHGIEFRQAWAREIHPEGDAGQPAPYVVDRAGGTAATEQVPYDFLINATGPRLSFDKTDGLGPDGQQPVGVHGRARRRRPPRRWTRRSSGCAPASGSASWSASVTAPAPARARRSSTPFNLEFELRARGVRDNAEIVWIYQRVRARRLRHGRHALRARRFRVPEQTCSPSRCSPSAASTGSPAPTSSRSTRNVSATRPSTARSASRTSTSPCCCRRSRRRPEGLRPRRRRHHRRAVPAQRLHAGGRRLRRQAATSSGARRLAADLPVTRLRQRLRRRDRVRPAARDLRPAHQPERHRDRARRRRAPACRPR